MKETNGNPISYDFYEKKCILCEQVKGVIVNVPKFGYVHISCVNWDIDIYFEEISTLIDGELNKQRKNLHAFIVRSREDTKFSVSIKVAQRVFM